jgi:biopolymer transport protein ExbD
MAIAVGGSKDGPVSDPNVVPLIDVLLVLIIIFMVITPRVPTGLPTIVPQPPPPNEKQPPPDNRTIVVSILNGGKLMINQDQSDWNSLGSRLFDIFKERADKVAFVKGDDDVSFAQVSHAIDIMRGAGIDHVGLITAKIEAGQ